MRLIPLIASVFAVVEIATCYKQPEQVSYDGYKVIRLHAGSKNVKVVDIVEGLDLETWQTSGHFTDIVLPPHRLQVFELKAAGINKTVMHEDLGVSIAAEQMPIESLDVAARDIPPESAWFTSYHQYQDHLQFLKELVARYPNNSELVIPGKSHQGNEMVAIHIYGSRGKGVMPAVVFHGTVHAREWITTMAVEYSATSLLTKYDSDPEIKSFVDKYDFYLYPVVNPDGFTWSQTNDRLWRKNRQATPESTCIGHDINRNWDYMWDALNGASNDPCAHDFRGWASADTPETQVLSYEIQKIHMKQGLQLYIDWHAYSQLLMTPYAHSCTHIAKDDDELQALGKGAAAAMTSLHGTDYESGRACPAMYEASGSSMDYVKDMASGKYVYAVELRDTGNHGFLLPPAEILPTSEEAFEGVKYLLRHMK